MISLRFLFFTLALLLLLLPAPTQAFWDRLLKAKSLKVQAGNPNSEQAQTEPLPQLRIGTFTGGTGSSARVGLRTELQRVEGLELLPDDAATPAAGQPPVFEVSGHSVGGRVTGVLRKRPGKPLFERTYAAPGLDENLKALADDLIFMVTGKPGLATTRIVFVSNQSGTRQIYLCDSEGGNIQQLTRDRHGAVSPTITPDASLLAFTSYRSGFPSVILMELGGGMERVVTDTPGINSGAVFAPDGRHLALVMSFLGNPEIFVSDLTTNTAACITESVGVPCSPAWSPNGERLIFSSDEGSSSQLYVADFGSAKSPGDITRWGVGFPLVTDPEWSPDGESIAFTARGRSGWLVGIKDYPSGRTRVVQRGARHPSWSPNGAYLVYTRGGDLYRHDLRSGMAKPIIRGFGEITEPRWMH